MDHDVADRENGIITEEWDDTEIYNDLSKMIKEYLFVKGKNRIVSQLVLYSVTVLLFMGKDYFVGALSLHVYHWTLGVYLIFIFCFWFLAEVVSMFRN